MLSYFINIITNRQFDFFEFLLILAAYAMIILVSLPVHEFAHGFVADKLGDGTARWNGRLTLNPFAHLDVFGTLMILLFGFGYAKPVPVNPRNFRNYKSGMALTALAGPLSNLIMAFLTAGIFSLLYHFVALNSVVYFIVRILLLNFMAINIRLAIFNLLPIPPLDGFRILANVLPARWTNFVNQYQQIITMLVMLLLFTGMLSRPLNYLTDGVLIVFQFIFRVPFYG